MRYLCDSQATNKEQAITIKSSGGLSDDQIQQMVRDAEAFAGEDKKRKEAIEAKNEAETLLYSAEKSLAEYKVGGTHCTWRHTHVPFALMVSALVREAAQTGVQAGRLCRRCNTGFWRCTCSRSLQSAIDKFSFDAQDKVPQNVADEISSAIASTREVAQSSEDPEAIRAKVPEHMDLSVACCTWLSITVWPSP